jgi:DNA-binding transcriptional MerR regulator
MSIKKFRPLRTTDDFGILEELTFLDVNADKYSQRTLQSPPPATPRPRSVSPDTGPNKTMSREEVADTKTLDLASARKRMQETGEMSYVFQLPAAMSTPLPQIPVSMSTPLPPSMKEDEALKTPKEISPAAPTPPPEENLPRLTSHQPMPYYDLETVVTKSGVHAMTLRTWERRYGIPLPSRGAYPLYSRRDLAAVRWLRTRVEAGLSVCQAMAELARHEPEYITSKGANDLLAANSVPQRHDFPELNESLLRAFILLDEAGAERILAQAFATHPASFVCQRLLQVVVAKIIEMRKQNTLPLAVEVLVARVTRSQVVHLIEAGLSPKEALKRLSTLTLRATHMQAVAQHEQEQRLKHAPDLYALEDLLIEAIMHMDESRVQSILDEAFSYYPVEEVCLKLLQVVLYRVGMLWEEKKISVMIEHFASNIIRTRLAHLFQSTPNLRQGPTMLLCPKGDTRDRYPDAGALLAARGATCLLSWADARDQQFVTRDSHHAAEHRVSLSHDAPTRERVERDCPRDEQDGTTPADCLLRRWRVCSRSLAHTQHQGGVPGQ